MAASKASLLDVGNCDPDHGAISRMLTRHFNVAIDRVMHVDEALERMRDKKYDLVLVNRLIFEDGSEGIDLLRQAKADPSLAAVPIMMISNFEAAQQKAVTAGAKLGFGKDSLQDSGTIERLSEFLPLR